MEQPHVCTNVRIELHDLEDFLEQAKTSLLVIYQLKYFSSPFIHETKIQSVTCQALGVKLRGVSVTLNFHKSWKNSTFPNNKKRINPKEVIDSEMRAFIVLIKNKLNAVEGTICTEKKNWVWDELMLDGS